MRLSILLVLFISFVQPSFAGTNNDRIAGNRADYLKNKIAGGEKHTLEIRNGALWAWGHNKDGQLGDGTTTDKNKPIRIGTADNWMCVAAGVAHSLGIKTDGTLWSWGWNAFGQLGNGTTTGSNVPIQVGADNNWVGVTSNGFHNLALKADGTLWAWGHNIYGQLGDGSTTNRNVPVQIGTARDWVTITVSGRHSLAIKSNGTLWAWGENVAGELGDGTRIDRIVPIQVGTANNWISVATGREHTIALQANGTLWAWGKNNSGQLGNGTYNDTIRPVQIDTARNWKYIAVGAINSLALKADGTLWAWGRNSDGEVGDSTNTNRNVPVHIGKTSRWKCVYGTAIHTLGITADGTAMAWGDNAYGQLGDGTNADKNYPVVVHKADDEWLDIAAFAEHCLGLKMDGTLLAWGLNIEGQLGDGTDTNRNTQVQVGTASDWISVEIGGYNTFGIRADGTLWAWGENKFGQLGDSSTIGRKSPVQVGKANDWVSISADWEHTMGLKADGTLWIWGDNDNAQLGDGTIIGRISPKQLGTANDWTCISAKGDRSYGIKSNGTLWAWGSNWAGLLGIGTGGWVSTPVQIGTDTNWVTISAGNAHCLAQKADGTLWLWGDDEWDQCGGSVSNRYQASPMMFGTANDWVSISAGGANSRAINSGGTLWAFGWNGDGALGLGNSSSRGGPDPVGGADNWVKVVGGGAHSIGIKANRSKICATGYNGNGALGDGTNNDRYTYHCYCTPVKTYTMPGNISYCAGTNTGFAIKGRYAITHQWQVNTGSGWTTLSDGGIYSHTNTDSLVLTNVTAAYDKYWYRCVRGNHCNESVISDSAQLVLNVSKITVQPADSSVCANTDAGFALIAVGGPFQYQWQVNNGSGWSSVANTGMYSGADKDTLLLKAAPTTVNGYKYRCIVGGVCAPDDTTDEAILTITTKYSAPAITQPGNARILVNTDTIFTITATDPDIIYQWQADDGNGWLDVSNGGVYNGATTDTLKLTAVPYTMNGYLYRCMAIRPCAPIATSTAATLTVDTLVTGISTTNVIKRFTLRPNPNNGTFSIDGELVNAKAGMVDITILNTVGQIIHTETIQLQTGKINHTVRTRGDLPNGTYTLKLDYDGEVDYKRFVILK